MQINQLLSARSSRFVINYTNHDGLDNHVSQSVRLYRRVPADALARTRQTDSNIGVMTCISTRSLTCPRYMPIRGVDRELVFVLGFPKPATLLWWKHDPRSSDDFCPWSEVPSIECQGAKQRWQFRVCTSTFCFTSKPATTVDAPGQNYHSTETSQASSSSSPSLCRKARSFL